MHFRVYQDGDGYWRWRLRGGNNEIIASGEAYVRKDSCLNAVELVKSSWNAPVYD